MSDAAIEKSFKCGFKQDEEKKYAPKMTVKVLTTGKKKTSIYKVVHVNGEEMYMDGSVEDINANSYVLPIVEFGGIWISPLGFGSEFYASQMLVWPNAKPPEFSFNLPSAMKRAPSDLASSATKCLRVDTEDV